MTAKPLLHMLLPATLHGHVTHDCCAFVNTTTLLLCCARVPIAIKGNIQFIYVRKSTRGAYLETRDATAAENLADSSRSSTT